MIWDSSLSSNSNISSSNRDKSSCQEDSERCKRRNQKNQYAKILDQLPQEIRDKLDKSKENVDDMWKTLTLPTNYKPSNVLKWMKKVSQNELKLIYDEIFKIRVVERKYKLEEQLSYESIDEKDASWSSLRLKFNSKGESDKFVSIRSRDTPNRIVNYNPSVTEGNSACSKTSSNTKRGWNLVKIPLEPTKSIDRMKNNQNDNPAYCRSDPKIVSIVPGKSILIKFERPEVVAKPDGDNLKWKRNILKARKSQDIAVENLSKSSQKENIISLLPDEANQSIHAFSSICWHDEPELHYDSHSVNNNYIKEEDNFDYIVQPAIPQLIESDDDCSDLYVDKSYNYNINPIKGFEYGNQLHVLNQFCNNITPIFSINEELADQLRPDVLDIKGMHKGYLDLSSNHPDFPSGIDNVIMYSEEFKYPIETHNQ
jgi:hypothetical protein